MPSLIEQLQAEAMDPTTSVADLLRKAKVVATKLGLTDAAVWVEHELNGYPSGADIPGYREITGEAKCWNPFRGWIPLVFEDADLQARMSRYRLQMPIAELEALIGSKGDLRLPYPAALIRDFSRATGHEIAEGGIAFGKNQISRVLDAVRSRILDWAVQLEMAGVKGEGTVSFSKKDREAAASTTYNISIGGSVTGAVGGIGGLATVNASTLITPAAIDALKSLATEVAKHAAHMDLPPEQKILLEKEAAALSQELAEAKPSPQKVKGFLSSIRNVAEGAAGSVVATGILHLLSRPEIAALLTYLP